MTNITKISTNVENFLIDGANTIGIKVRKDEAQSFETYYKELIKWGSKINVTALLDSKKKIFEELFLDSLAPLLVINRDDNPSGSLLDIGSGGGFPGIPIKIATSSLDVTLCDSIEKKVFFMRNIIRKLNLSQIEALVTKFDDNGSQEAKINHFDWVVSKAVTDIETLGQWARPHLKQKGSLVCMKGPKEEAINLSGFSSPQIINYMLPYSNRKRRLYLYLKD